MEKRRLVRQVRLSNLSKELQYRVDSLDLQKAEATGLPRVVPRLPLSARGRAPDLWESGCGGACVGIPVRRQVPRRARRRPWAGGQAVPQSGVDPSAQCVDAKSTRDPFGSLLRIYCIEKANLFLSAITHDLESPNPSSAL